MACPETSSSPVMLPLRGNWWPYRLDWLFGGVVELQVCPASAVSVRMRGRQHVAQHAMQRAGPQHAHRARRKRCLPATTLDVATSSTSRCGAAAPTTPIGLLAPAIKVALASACTRGHAPGSQTKKPQPLAGLCSPQSVGCERRPEAMTPPALWPPARGRSRSVVSCLMSRAQVLTDAQWGR